MIPILIIIVCLLSVFIGALRLHDGDDDGGIFLGVGIVLGIWFLFMWGSIYQENSKWVEKYRALENEAPLVQKAYDSNDKNLILRCAPIISETMEVNASLARKKERCKGVFSAFFPKEIESLTPLPLPGIETEKGK